MTMYYGTVKSYNAEKGYGFIDCPDLHYTYGKDVFLLKSAVPNGVVNAGDDVAFAVVDERGKGPVATNVQITPSGRAGGCRGPSAYGGGGYAPIKAEPGMRAAPQNWSAPQSWSKGGWNGQQDGTYLGNVKIFDANKGWGMIACDETHRQYQKDVFVPAKAVPGGFLQVGQDVRFSVAMESKGPTATNVFVTGFQQGPPQQGRQHGSGKGNGGKSNLPTAFARPSPYGPLPAAFALQRFGPPSNVGPPSNAGRPRSHSVGGGGGGHAQNSFWGPPAAPAPPSHAAPKADQVFIGTVKAFNAEKGWGHIGCDATNRLWQKDVFIMKSSFVDKNITEIQPGAQVSFKASLAQRGPQATEVMEIPVDTIRAPGQQGRAMYGSVKSWNSERGYGFLAGDEVKAFFGKDIFLHKRELGEGSRDPELGENACFYIELDNSGQPQAKSVSLQGSNISSGIEYRDRSSTY